MDYFLWKWFAGLTHGMYNILALLTHTTFCYKANQSINNSEFPNLCSNKATLQLIQNIYALTVLPCMNNLWCHPYGVTPVIITDLDDLEISENILPRKIEAIQYL